MPLIHAEIASIGSENLTEDPRLDENVLLHMLYELLRKLEQLFESFSGGGRT